MDECASGVHACHKNASCINTAGSYKCSCKNPYTEDGNTCNLAAGNNQENCYKSSTLGWEFPYKSDREANRLYGYKLQVLVSRRGMVFDLSTSKTGSTEGI